jgi:Thiamine pyrophosphate-requiring enzymes [acetolactate synthase, pyruvate dehydrogenase (cytochrome), glyoxylate carboligase, phosphonopyruvate decarboxylase]
MTVSEYIFNFLSKKGVDTAFVVTGGQAMWLNDALARSKSIRSVFCHHEQSCAMSADAFGRLTNKLGLAVVTAGPGSVNVINGLVGGWTDSSPMMIISGQSALSSIKYIETSGIRQYGIQGINIRPFVENACKYFVTVDDPINIKFYLEKAYYLAKNGRPGPVWIDVPLDIQRMHVPEKLTMGYTPENETIGGRIRKELISSFTSRLAQSKRPLIIAGQGVRLANATKELREFVEKYRIPIVTTRLGIDVIESGHELYVGRPGNYGERSANFAIQNADFILTVGSRLATAAVGHNPKSFGKHAYKVVVDIDQKELDKPGFPIDLKIKDDAKSFLEALIEFDINYKVDTEEWVKQCNLWKKKFPVVLEDYKNTGDARINSYYFVEKLSEQANENDMILVDTGSCFHVACQAWKIKKGQRYLTTGGLSSMGYWVAGIGACAANDYKKTIVITGDGSFQMNIQDIATIAHNKLPIKVFIFNNNGYLLIRQTQHNYMEDRFYGEGPSSGVWCPDAMKIADAYGIKGVRIEKVSELDSKIQEVLEYEGPVICDVLTEEWQMIVPRVASDKMPDGSLRMRNYEDMFPFLPADEYKENMVAEKED